MMIWELVQTYTTPNTAILKISVDLLPLQSFKKAITNMPQLQSEFQDCQTINVTFTTLKLTKPL